MLKKGVFIVCAVALVGCGESQNSRAATCKTGVRQIVDGPQNADGHVTTKLIVCNDGQVFRVND